MGRRRKGLPIHGWLVIDKPLDMSSAQVVGKVRYLTKAAKVGHGGTLDPLATGVLPIALGEATKTVPYIMDGRKTYRFVVTWGEERSTDDAEGDVTRRSDHYPTDDEIKAALPGFIGRILQTPPAYSAIKVAGQRAYDLARRGEDVSLSPREVDIFDLKLVPDTTLAEGQSCFEVDCGKGTYVRAIARDLGRALGSCGYVSELRRTRVGPFAERESISLDKLGDLVHSAPLKEQLLPVVTVLDDISALAVTVKEAARIQQGQILAVPDHKQGLVRVMCEDQLIALAEMTDGRLKLLRVFNITD
ncbi:MAG: tRNA pseudouridine(55) synthase TruB [Kordiimonas sp.]|nr:tRNA pseudouridine(55) synthase TruB [Kordiimonas sp.]|tara:strand:+ start:4288 stop:5196 length:909 start_codon:yes stop_codon:yes gene_type:complete